MTLRRDIMAIQLLPYFAVVYLLFGLYSMLATYDFVEHAHAATGYRVSIDEEKINARRAGNVPLYFPVIRYVDQQQVMRQFTGHFPVFKRWALAEEYPVLYRKNKHGIDARINDVFSLWSSSFLYLCFGVLGLILARWVAPRRGLHLIG